MTKRTRDNGNYTHIAVVLDRSCSMSGLKSSTISGFNEFLQAQKKIDGRGTITMVHFANDQTFTQEMEPLESMESLTNSTYDPSGYSTALLDSIGRTINRVEASINEFNDKPDNVVFVIITDGCENSSREFSRDQVMEMIKRHEDEDEWNFVFIGANQDAIQEGGSIGVRASNSKTFGATNKGVGEMYTSLTTSMNSYRSRSSSENKRIGFFDNEDAPDTANLVGETD